MNAVLTGALFVAGTILIALSVYAFMRRIVGDKFDDKTETLAGSVIFRVSALHGLILALVFAQELYDYTELQSNLVDEATAIADIYNDIARYGTEAQPAVQTALARYTQLVIDEEWTLLAEDNVLSSEGWRLRETVYQALLDLNADSARQETLRSHMIEKIQLIAELRQERENNALHDMNLLFWVAAFAGLILVTVPYFVFSPTPLHIALLAVYGGFSGLVMFIIFAFADPFSSPGALEPLAFERLVQQGIGD